MTEPDRQSQLNRMEECVRLAEAAYDEMYESRTLQPAGPYSDVKQFYAEAIGLARQLGLHDEVAKLEKRLAHSKEIFRSQFAGRESSLTSVQLWPPAPVPEHAREETKILIRQNALYVSQIGQTLTSFGFSYDDQTVQWMDGFIKYLRTRLATIEDLEHPDYVYDLWARSWRIDDFDSRVSHLGAFLGEAIIDNYGGQWDFDDEGWNICFDENNRAYPLAKVAKQLTNGSEDSIFSFYSAIPIVFGRPLKHPW